MKKQRRIVLKTSRSSNSHGWIVPTLLWLHEANKRYKIRHLAQVYNSRYSVSRTDNESTKICPTYILFVLHKYNGPAETATLKTVFVFFSCKSKRGDHDATLSKYGLFFREMYRGFSIETRWIIKLPGQFLCHPSFPLTSLGIANKICCMLSANRAMSMNSRGDPEIFT